MQTSSKFFKKTFINVQQDEINTIEEQEQYGPWSIQLKSINQPLKKNRSARKKYSKSDRKHYSSFEKNKDYHTMDEYPSEILNQNGVFVLHKSLKNIKNKRLAEKIGYRQQLPHIKIQLPNIHNPYPPTNLFQTPLLNVQSGLNFIKQNNYSSLRKYNHKHKFELIRKSINPEQSHILSIKRAFLIGQKLNLPKIKL